jgi:hypothetical protein
LHGLRFPMRMHFPWIFRIAGHRDGPGIHRRHSRGDIDATFGGSYVGTGCDGGDDGGLLVELAGLCHSVCRTTNFRYRGEYVCLRYRWDGFQFHSI